MLDKNEDITTVLSHQQVSVEVMCFWLLEGLGKWLCFLGLTFRDINLFLHEPELGLGVGMEERSKLLKNFLFQVRVAL